jgi:hypothetical protein
MLQSSKVRANALLIVFIAEFLVGPHRPPSVWAGLRTFYAAAF